MAPKRLALLVVAMSAMAFLLASQTHAPLQEPDVERPLFGRLAAPGPAVATTQRAAVHAMPFPEAVADASPGAAVDTRALRWFVDQGDRAAAASETAALRAAHPGWEPAPALLRPSGPSVDERGAWEALRSGGAAAARASEAGIAAAAPGWEPSPALADAVAAADARATLVSASDAGRWDGVVAVARGHQSMLSCDDPDALWRTAEALVRTGESDRAMVAYRFVLRECGSAPVRLATVRKAASLLASTGDVASLVDAGDRRPSGPDEFHAVRMDILRGSVGKALAEGRPWAPPAADVTELALSARSPGGAEDAQALGWLLMARKDPRGAADAFACAGALPKAREGLALALRDQGRAAEARRVALADAGLSPANRDLMLSLLAPAVMEPRRAPLPAATVRAYAGAALESGSADAALAMGWHDFHSGEPASAAAWFHRSLDRHPGESAAIGVLVSDHATHATADYRATLARHGAAFPRLVALDASMNPPQARVAPRARPRLAAAASPPARRPADPAAWDAGATLIADAAGSDPRRALAMLDARRSQRGGEPAGLSVVRAWAQYHAGDWEGAKRTFEAMDPDAQRRERGEGLREIEAAYRGPRWR